MKKIVASLTFVGWAAACMGQGFMTNGLVAFYPFDGSAADTSGNGRNGVAAGVTPATNRFGASAGSFYFNGTNSVVTVSSLASFNFTNLTLSAWVNPNALPSVQASIINKWAAFVGTEGDWALLLLSDLRPHFGNGRHSSSQVITSTNALATNQWYHIVETTDSLGNAKLWVNGVLQASGNVSPLLPPASQPVRIGYMVNGTGAIVDTFKGNIDDVRIYDRALSETEVQQLYAFESQPPALAITNGLVAFYPFDASAADLSGNGRDGVAAGVTAAANRFGTPGSAYYFNGTNSAVTVSSLASFNVTNLTLSAWVKPTAIPAVQASIVNKWAAFVGSQADWALLLLSDLHPHFGNGRHSTSLVITGTNALATNQWYHIVEATDSLGNAKLWVNGFLQASGNVSPLLPPASQPVRIGYMVNGTGAIVDTFKGSIDDVRIYNRAFTDMEAQQLYAFESQPPPCLPRRATATIQVVNGFVVGATVTDPGCGYTNAPVISITGSGSGASAVATIENGAVTGITIVSTGSGYTGSTLIRLSSPPFEPWLEMGVSRVKVTMHVNIGYEYVLESSNDLSTWTQVGTSFTAQQEDIVQEFDVDSTGRYFRLRQVR